MWRRILLALTTLLALVATLLVAPGGGAAPVASAAAYPVVHWPGAWVNPIQSGGSFTMTTRWGAFSKGCANWDRTNGATSYLDSGTKAHTGLDMDHGDGARVVAIADGVVVENGMPWGSSNRNVVVIEHTASSGEKFLAVYGHLHSDVVAKGSISRGDYVGRVQTAGTGEHLHFGIKPGGWHGVTPNGSSQSTVDGARNCTFNPVGTVDPLAYLGSHTPVHVVRRSDGVSWVLEGGQRHHIPNLAVDICAVHVRRLPVVNATSPAQYQLPDGSRHECSLNGRVIRASDGPEPKPAFVFRDNKRWVIPDGQTWKYWTITKGWPVLNLPRSLVTDGRIPEGGTEPKKLYAPDYEGKIIRRTDDISWVVVGGQRHHIPTYATDVCAEFVHGRPYAGRYVDSQTSSIPEGAPYVCDLNGRILRASNAGDPKPSYTYRDNKRHWIQDVWTYDYYVRQGYPVVDLPHGAITDPRLTNGGNETRKLNPQSIPVNTIIRREGNPAVSWVVDSNRVRHHIPFAQDDVCWRFLGGRGFGPLQVSATGLSYDQARQLPEGDAWPCIIGDRVVRGDDGKSWFVNQANQRRWIPDTDTYAILARSHPVSGPWPAGEVEKLPPGPEMPRKIDPEAVKNSIICRSDNVCWAVDGNGVRHHIPTHADNVCWRWVHGWQVKRSGLSAELADTLSEGEPWGCSLNDRIIATNEGPAYYMAGNQRRWIPDGYDFDCLSRGRHVIRGMSLGEASGIPEIGAMPAQECAGIDIVTIYSPHANRYVTTEINYGGADYAMVRAARTSVGSDWERFRLIGDCSNRCLIQSLNNRKLVMPQLDYQGYAWGEMRGVSSNPNGSWEGFRLVGNCNTGCAIYALGNGRYVSAELDYTGAGYGMLRARSTSWSGWETFLIR